MANSPIDQSAMLGSAEFEDTAIVAAPEEQAFASVAGDKKWTVITDYLKGRQEFYRSYMPDGRSIADVAPEEAGGWWKSAAIIIAEFDELISTVETTADAVKRNR
jgi:hypothetical protein